MKVLHVNYMDVGGAAIAMQRLHAALSSIGIDSECLYFRSNCEKETPYCNTYIKTKLNGIANILLAKLCGPSDPVIRSVNLFPSGLVHYLNHTNADVIHLHWVNGEMISIHEIGRICKPIVWTMHDMWPFCGAEHYTTSSRFREGYSHHTYTESPKELRRPLDVDRWVWSRKKRSWKNLELYPVAVSNWLGDLARNSSLFGNLDISVVHNTLDLSIFAPIDKRQARLEFNLPVDTKLILFGSSGNWVGRKGFDLLKTSLEKLVAHFSEPVELVVFGDRILQPVDGVKTHILGRIGDQNRLASLYNAADVMCVPSRQESFGQTASEALACGIPVVAFNATGLKDIVDHQCNGYLAEPYNTDDYMLGIEWILNITRESRKYEQLRCNARNKAVHSFNSKLVTDRYMQIYENAIGKLSEGVD